LLLLLAVFSVNLHCQLDNEMVLDSVVIYGYESLAFRYKSNSFN
jgi:hypothetical protein